MHYVMHVIKDKMIIGFMQQPFYILSALSFLRQKRLTNITD